MNEYKAMKERHQQEVHAFPLGYAFGNRQFKELMSKWGLDADKKEDLAQVSSLFGGAYILKKDIPAYRDMCRRHQEERKAAIAADQTGDGYIYQMFLCELEDHEYGYTRDTEDALTVLGYTAQDVLGDPRLKHGIEKAVTQIVKSEEQK